LARADTISGENDMHVEQIAFLTGQAPWTAAPEECEPEYFRCWQHVSLALQKSFRRWGREIYFRDPARFEDRDAAYTMIVWSACRPCFGRPRYEFTFDVADPRTFGSAWRLLGKSLRGTLAPIEKRLREAGEFELAHHYAPVWHQDILVAVKKRPRPFIRLIATEARLVDAVIDLGTRRDEHAATRFHRIASNVLRSFLGEDMRELTPMVLDEAGRVLSARRADFNPRGALAPLIESEAEALRGLKPAVPGFDPDRTDHLVDGWVAKHGHARAAGSPDSRIGGEEDGDHRRPHRGRQVADARIVAEVDPRGREPARQRV